jgi:hypothetical protein
MVDPHVQFFADNWIAMIVIAFMLGCGATAAAFNGKRGK